MAELEKRLIVLKDNEIQPVINKHCCKGCITLSAGLCLMLVTIFVSTSTIHSSAIDSTSLFTTANLKNGYATWQFPQGMTMVPGKGNQAKLHRQNLWPFIRNSPHHRSWSPVKGSGDPFGGADPFGGGDVFGGGDGGGRQRNAGGAPLGGDYSSSRRGGNDGGSSMDLPDHFDGSGGGGGDGDRQGKIKDPNLEALYNRNQRGRKQIKDPALDGLLEQMGYGGNGQMVSDDTGNPFAGAIRKKSGADIEMESEPLDYEPVKIAEGGANDEIAWDPEGLLGSPIKDNLIAGNLQRRSASAGQAQMKEVEEKKKQRQRVVEEATEKLKVERALRGEQLKNMTGDPESVVKYFMTVPMRDFYFEIARNKGLVSDAVFSYLNEECDKERNAMIEGQNKTQRLVQLEDLQGGLEGGLKMLEEDMDKFTKVPAATERLKRLFMAPDKDAVILDLAIEDQLDDQFMDLLKMNIHMARHANETAKADYIQKLLSDCQTTKSQNLR